jgi:hypothetical protein
MRARNACHFSPMAGMPNCRMAAALPAASATSGEEIGEGAVSASRARRVREAK